jgi:hypothetical protein
MVSAAKDKNPGARAVDYVKTEEEIAAGLAGKEAAAKADKAAKPERGDPTHDSPKRHGDKLERARDAAAGHGKAK